MTQKRFFPEGEEDRLVIVDDEGVDDYYFVNNKEELQQFCNMINKREDKIKKLEKDLKDWEVLAKQLNIRNGSIAYLTILSLDYPDTILHIAKDEKEPGAVKIYVKKDYNELLLKSFMGEIPLEIKYKVLVVTDVQTKEVLPIM